MPEIPNVKLDPQGDRDLLVRFAHQANAPFLVDKGHSYKAMKAALGDGAIEFHPDTQHGLIDPTPTPATKSKEPK